MNNTDLEYNRLVKLVLEKGRIKKNRTGVDTLGVFGAQARFDLSEGFPLLTTKRVFMKAITHELLWFLSGSTNIKYLVDNDVHIWDEWAAKRYFDENGAEAINTQKDFIQKIKSDACFAAKWGELGEGTYGGMWRDFPVALSKFQYRSEVEKDTGLETVFGCSDNILIYGVDQIKKVIRKLETNPDDRRMIVSAWHPYLVDHCALPPCHCLFQFHTEELTKQERWDIYTSNQNRVFPPIHIWCAEHAGAM